MSSFTQIVRNATANNITPFTGSPMRNDKITKSYRKYIRTIDNNAPLPLNLAFNPKTNRIVKYSSVYDLRYNKPVYKAPIKKYLQFNNYQQKIKSVNSTIGKTESFDFTTVSNIGLEKFFSMLNISNPILMSVYNTDGRITHYTLNEKTLPRISTLLSGIENAEYTSTAGSDEEAIINIRDTKKFTLKRLPKSKKQNGGFYKYTLKYPLPDVEKYGIFTSVNGKNYNECCFINALIASGKVEESVIANIKLFIKCTYLPMCKIKQIVEKFNLNIVIRGLDTKSKRINQYGDKSNVCIEIGMVDNHYFYNDKTQMTSYALKNYEELISRDPLNWNTYIKKHARDKKSFISSLQMFKLFRENEHVRDFFLEPITINTELFNTPHFQKIDDFPALAVNNKDYKPAVDHDAREQKQEAKEFFTSITSRVWFDFETDIYGDKHLPYLGWYTDEDGACYEFIGRDCGKQMLNHLYKQYGNKSIESNGKNYNKKVLMIAHNASYDFTTAIFEHLYGVETIEKGSSLMSANGKYYYYGNKTPLDICIHDSYAKIPEPLRKFGKMFKLDQEKEVMPYPIYTSKNIEKKFITLKACLKTLKRKDHKQFISNCEKWKCIQDNKVNIIKYSSLYCRMDCIVLRAGYLKFGDMMRELAGVNIDHFISSASLADEYLLKNGCYDDCTQLCGVPRAFIQRCLVGGRTMLNNNEQQHSFNVPMADYDAVSLYPSAMSRLNGFLRGSPKLIDTNNYEALCNGSDGFYIRVKINSVGTHRDFPLLSYVNDEGIRMFTNDMVGKTVYIDDVALADAVMFQDVTFDIIDGYKFDEGFNNKIIETITHLFNARLKAKSEGNPIQAVIKLIMNSCYGKTALKEINEDSKYISNKNFDEFVSRQYNWIKEAVETDDKRGYRVKCIKPINQHYNRVHIGVQILSMSKRIMNEVMCIADDEKLKIFYQDTDSMHIYNNDVPTLEKAFSKKYGRQLNGKGMGQFHVDFEFNTKDKNEEGEFIKAKNIYAEKSVFLGKKSYIDCLVGEDKDGKTVKDYHIRMKGVPNSSILGECKKRQCTPFDLYEELRAGKRVRFNLLIDEDGDDKVRFKKNTNVTMTTVKEFTREVKF